MADSTLGRRKVVRGLPMSRKKNPLRSRQGRKMVKGLPMSRKKNPLRNRQGRKMVKASLWCRPLRWLRAWLPFRNRKAKLGPVAVLKDVLKDVNTMEFLQSTWLKAEDLDKDEDYIYEPDELISSRIAWRKEAQTVMGAIKNMREYLADGTAPAFFLEECVETLKDKVAIQRAHTYFAEFPRPREVLVHSVAELVELDRGQNITIMYNEYSSVEVKTQIKEICTERDIKVRGHNGSYPEALL